jgi:hypothetical protein
MAALALLALLPASAFALSVPDGPLLPTYSRASLGWKPAPCPLPTQWTALVNASNPRPEYPRPQLIRNASLLSLNGVWEWQPDSSSTPGSPPSGPLSGSILVPFPVESCLSGVMKNYDAMWYQLRNVSFPPLEASTSNLLLHVEASDWRTTVFCNGANVGSNVGGYNRFSVDLTACASGNKAVTIAIHVYDPSDAGSQPFGKQKVSSITSPSGDHYTPSSGIWAPVWLEIVPATYVQSLKMTPSLTSLRINVSAMAQTSHVPIGTVVVTVKLVSPSGSVTVEGAGLNGVPMDVVVPSPQLWSPSDPNLYTVLVTMGSDSVSSYAGLRTVGLGQDAKGVTRPLLNGQPIYFNAYLDQGFWPDGIYSAPTDAALLFDLQSTLAYGLNTIRKHQKIEPLRLYYYADNMGLLLWQDFVQHFFGNGDFGLFMADGLTAIEQLYNAPSIVQWDIFNEYDCCLDAGFNGPLALSQVRAADPSRLIDLNSGGPLNALGIGDVNDIHHYSPPAFPAPSSTQYAALGEYGGVGLFIPGHEWASGKCYGYDDVSDPGQLVTKLQGYFSTVQANQNSISASVYTQTTDLETECDGPVLNYDRSSKLSQDQFNDLAAINKQMSNPWA